VTIGWTQGGAGIGSVGGWEGGEAAIEGGAAGKCSKLDSNVQSLKHIFFF
jgi:hypothetical protein